MAATVTRQDSHPGSVAPRSFLLFIWSSEWVEKSCLILAKEKKSMEAQRTLTYFQTPLPEAVVFSVCSLGGPLECSGPWLCWETPAILPPSWEQASGQRGLGVSLAVSSIHELCGKEWMDVWWVCSTHSIPGGFCFRYTRCSQRLKWIFHPFSVTKYAVRITRSCQGPLGH